jgi:hypothetical protein
MKRSGALSLLAGFIACMATSGCSNTLVYGESTEFNLAIHVNDNPQTPVEVNAGLKRYVGEKAPPLALKDDKDGHKKAEGEAVSSFSGFALEYEENPLFALAGTLHIRTQFASGAAAAALAKNPIQAVTVVKTRFDRDPAFVLPETQDRHERIVVTIEALDDAAVVALACDPPIHSANVRTEAAASDPGCVKRKDPAFARQFLVDRSFEDDRTEESFKGWESKLGIQ